MIQLGSIVLGKGYPVRIQSMCNTQTHDVKKTVAQIHELVAHGCEIVRVAVPDQRAVDALNEIVESISIPLVADIHFDPQLAIGAICANVAGIRINPGNMGGFDALKSIATHAIKHNTCIRVGGNSGSVRALKLKENLQKHPLAPQLAMAETLVDSTLEQIQMLEQFGLNNIKVSLKASDVKTTVLAAQLFAQRSDYPQHIGITEAGTLQRGIVKSSIGIGALLLQDIGSTIRVSLTADPIEEVKCAIRILEALHLRNPEPEIVSCPTCGRCQVALQALAEKVDIFIDSVKRSNQVITAKKIAVMGCAVNGPGEARDADLALCGTTQNRVMLCEKGKAVGIFSADEAFEIFREKLIETNLKK